MGSSKSLVLLLFIQILIVRGVKLDFGDDSEVIKVKKIGTINGLRVTVDTSELKGSPK